MGTVMRTGFGRSKVSYDEFRQLCNDAALVGSAAALPEGAMEDICSAVQQEQPEANRKFLMFEEFTLFIELASQHSGVMVSKLLKPLQAALLPKMEDGDYKDWCAKQML